MCQFNEVFTSKLFSEDHCDLCRVTIHNHFICPVCKNDYAGTSIYCDIHEYLEDEKSFKCEECNSEFEIIKGDDYIDYDEFKVKLLSINS